MNYVATVPCNGESSFIFSTQRPRSTCKQYVNEILFNDHIVMYMYMYHSSEISINKCS